MLPLTFSILLSSTQSPLSHLSPSLTPLSPLLPLVPSQTNGAHYRLAKNSPAAKSIHFFPFPSSSLSPFLMLSIFSLFCTSLRREMSNGEKACQLIYQLAAHVQLSMLSGLSGCGAEGLGPDPWLSWFLLYGHGPWGTE